MKLLDKRALVLNQPGGVTLVPEESDDLWLLYHLICAGDVISADTTRKVYQDDGGGGGGKKNATRVKLELQIKITSVEYSKESPVIRVRGKSIATREHVKTGVFHTIELEKNKEFNLTKKLWDEESITALTDGCCSGSAADLAVILMDESSANLFLVGKKTTTACPVIHGNNRSKSNKYFENLSAAFVKHVDFNTVRCVVIGRPGSEKDEFRRYLLLEAQKSRIKSIENNKSRILIVKIKTGHNHKENLREILQDSAVMNLIKDTKSAIEIRAFAEFMEALSANGDRACYGLNSIEAANDLLAIETLLITEDLYRCEEIAKREKLSALVKSARKSGGKAVVLSTMNVSGEQLAQLTGIAAVLRFPVPDLDELQL